MDISLRVRSSSYQTAQGDKLTLYRPSVLVDFQDRSGRSVTLRCVIDTGAPLSVVPYSVWKPSELAWSSISKSLSSRGRSSALQWQGVPCELGYTAVDLAGVRKLIAKFVMGPSPPADVILGVNSLVDNNIELVLRGSGGTLSGFLSIP